jgi:hypothetical protein
MASSEEIDQLFRQYLEICNRAMQAHCHEFPYKQIWDAVERLQAGEPVDLTIYDDEPQHHYKVCLRDKHIDLVKEEPEEMPEGWKMNTSYLRRVVENPQEYIEQPARLDWDWLKDRAGF